MRSGKIPNSDSLFRSTIFPLVFGNNKAFKCDKFLRLEDEADGTISASLAWERYVPTVAHVHGYGSRLAAAMNENLPQKHKANKRRIYCGAYQLTGKMIRALADTEGLSEVVSADVIHLVEKGEIAHTNLRIVLRPESQSSAEGIKTVIVDRLWSACHGPLRHKCDCDMDIAEHPSSFLIVPPAGEYCDTRHFLLRIWSITRFHLSSWLWRNSMSNTAIFVINVI
jgi:hypothetical protein